MSEKTANMVREVAAAWSDIVPPNRPAIVLAGRMDATIAGFAAERGKMAFEAEPATFEAALQATKEGAL